MYSDLQCTISHRVLFCGLPKVERILSFPWADSRRFQFECWQFDMLELCWRWCAGGDVVLVTVWGVYMLPCSEPVLQQSPGHIILPYTQGLITLETSRHFITSTVRYYCRGMPASARCPSQYWSVQSQWGLYNPVCHLICGSALKQKYTPA